MSAATCAHCSRAQGHREHCCPTAAEAELQAQRLLIAELTNEIRGLRNENEILEDLRREAVQQAEAQGVMLW
jgi:hypothetical protein